VASDLALLRSHSFLVNPFVVFMTVMFVFVKKRSEQRQLSGFKRSLRGGNHRHRFRDMVEGMWGIILNKKKKIDL